LVAKRPSDTIIRYYLDQKKDKESDWLNFTQGLNLEGRDLCFADFNGSKLFKANLKYAQLQGAFLWRAQLQGADLEDAQLQGIWGKVDFITTINWDELSETASDLPIRSETRKSMLQGIEIAKIRCEKFDKTATSQALTSNINFEQFLAERSECVCLSEHVARSIIAQYQSRLYMYKEFQKQEPSITKEKILEDLREYMSKKCPEIANKIDWE